MVLSNVSYNATEQNKVIGYAQKAQNDILVVPRFELSQQCHANNFA